MGDKSGIAWTNATWNPLAGCTRVSRGCDNCYAAKMAATRLKHTPAYEGLATITPSGVAAFNGKIRLLPDRLDQPLRWRKPRRVFVNSMSDLFHEDVPWEFIDRVFTTMARAQQHVFQILTKRPERMHSYMIHWLRWQDGTESPSGTVQPLPNVWLGVSVEDQAAADLRIPLLLDTPGALLWASAEPLLGPVDLTEYLGWDGCRSGKTCREHPRLDWIVVGGESGPRHRPLDLAWAQGIRAQCRAAGVAYFGKQTSGARSGIALPDELGEQEYPRKEST